MAYQPHSAESAPYDSSRNGQSGFQLIAAAFTPFTPRGDVNYEVIGEYSEYLRLAGADGVFLCGTAGEGMSLTLNERKKIVETWRACAPDFRMLVHVGHPCLRDSKKLARHAEEHGVDGISAIGPIFFSPDSIPTFLELNRQIALEAPITPYYPYHMPAMSRMSEPVSSWLEEMARAIPTFRGVKFTHEDIGDYASSLKLAANRWEIFFGRDEILLQAVVAGAGSAMGSTYNFAIPLYRRMVESFIRGGIHEAEQYQKIAHQAIALMCRYGGLCGIKAVMAMNGPDVGPARLPLGTLSSRQTMQLKDELESISYFEIIRPSAGAYTP